jgi:hypothetical protein
MSDAITVSRGGRDPKAPVVGIPRQFDIVSCYFPHDETPNRPGVKPRPCLVLATRRSPVPGGLLYVKVAYGTTAAPNSGVFGEIRIHRPDSREAAGVHKQTKFVLARTAVVPFRFEFFRADRSGSVFLGRLLERDRTEADRMLAAATGSRERE